MSPIGALFYEKTPPINKPNTQAPTQALKYID